MKETPRKPKDFNIIASLRKSRKYSQTELADMLKISRQTVSKYENNMEGIYAELVVSIAQLFGVKYEYILENKPLPSIDYDDEGIDVKRVSLAITDDVTYRFEQIFIYMLENIGAKHNISQATYFYLLYFIELDYYEKYEINLLGLDFIKENSTPFPIGFANYIEGAIARKVISAIEVEKGNIGTKRYLSLVSPDLSALTAREIKSIDETLERLADKSLQELEFLISKDIPWLVAKSNELINYETVFYRNNYTSVRFYA